MPISASRPSPMPVALALGIALCVVGIAIGVPLGGTPATMIACGAILALGLPHGSLDIDLFKQGQPGVARSVILLLYIGFAGAMAGAWLVSPVVAFALFYVLAMAHFSEDWSRTGSAFLAQGMALALLAIPAFTHRAELTGLFAALTGAEASAVFVDLLRLVSPVAAMVAIVAIGLLWSIGARAEALGGALALIAMAMLPPVVGFALFFCLFHSPRHLCAGLAALSSRTAGSRGATILLLTLAAAGIATIAYVLGAQLPASDRLMTASFMTLSILTLPHMAVPIVLRVIRQASSGSPGAPGASPSLSFMTNELAKAAPRPADG